jgi:hypothetical protein
MDNQGCLTCHQYPGLVTYSERHSVKILHIDEQRYLKSAHGRLECRTCHATIARIPHTGDSTVNCNGSCHRSEAERRRIADYPLDDFHAKEQSAIIKLTDGSSCRVCHPLYPHSENNRVRAFLNLHTGFMICEVCHLHRAKYPDSSYDWTGAEIAVFKGPPYGTFYDPHLKSVQKSKNFISRISIFTGKDGQKRRLMNTWDTEAAAEFQRRQATLSPDARTKQLAFFHRDIDREEISVACDECHSHHGILDFKRLGFDAAMTNNLIQLDLKGLVTKYKTFYFPELFNN